MTLQLASLTSSITSFVGDHSVYAVFILMMIDAVFPAGSELVMVYAGALAAGTFSSQHVTLFGDRIASHGGAYVVIALAGTLGYLVGSLIGWGIGFYGGRPLFERRGRWLHLGPERLAQADRWFERRGRWAVLLGRITPVVRSFVSIPAGFSAMRLGPYTLLTLIGSAIWCFVFAAVGWAIGNSYRNFHSAFDYVSIAIVIAIVVVAGVTYRRWRQRRVVGAGEPPL